MTRRIASLFLRPGVAMVLLAMLAPTAIADAIASYTVTDLGNVPDVGSPGYKLSSTGDDGTLTAPDGKTVYAFPRTNNGVANPQSLFGALPPLTNAPVYDPMTYGNPKYAYSYFDSSGVFLNKAGEAVASDIVGVDGHIASAQSIVDMATRQADGSFGPLKALWNSPNNIYSNGQIAQALDLNNSGQVLGVNAGLYAYLGGRDFFVYDIHSGLKTELASLLPTGWDLDRPPIALDDQGRVLVYAARPYVPGQATAGDSSELLLLTPAGLSSDPIATPEPSALATLAVTGLALAVRRRWKS